ncbi:MAG: transposase family protein [Steroidobacteraceae bacterium]
MYYFIFIYRHTIKYEVGVRITDGQIVWISGPFPGKMHDNTMLRQGGLLEKIQDWELLLGDKGYQGNHKVVIPFKRNVTQTYWTQSWNAAVSNVRITVEWAIGRIKRFKTMNQKWRHSLKSHSVVFNVCAHIAQLSMYYFPVRSQRSPYLTQ